MRKDRRTPQVLQDLINRKVRVKLTSWEKRNIKDLYEQETGSKFQENCSSCWTKAIKVLSKLEPQEEQKPILVKEQMIVHEKTNKGKDKVRLASIEKAEVVEGRSKEVLMKEAIELAEQKGIKKPHPKTGVKKLEQFIKDNK